MNEHRYLNVREHASQKKLDAMRPDTTTESKFLLFFISRIGITTPWHICSDRYCIEMVFLGPKLFLQLCHRLFVVWQISLQRWWHALRV